MSSSLYEAFQMEDKSCEGPIYICRTSFYLLTEVKLGMIKLETFLVHTQAWFTRTTLGNPGCFNFFPHLVFFPLAVKTLHFFTLDLASFHSAGVSLLAGQWFLPVSLAMLSTAVLFISLSSHGALMSR